MSNIENLKNLCIKIGAGSTPTGGQNAYKIKGISLIRSQNIQDFYFAKAGLAYIDDKQAKKLANVEVQINDILLNITGDSIARACIIPEEILPARVNQHVSIIRVNEKIDARYLLYYLLFKKNHLLTISRVGGTRNALTKEALENFKIQLNKNHDKIGLILSTLDKKIEINNKINVELDSIVKTLYDYWFVQFDFPNEVNQPYKSSGGEMAYNKVLKRNIPKDWEVRTLEEIIDVKDGTHESPKYVEVGYPLITSKNLDIGGINFSATNKISKSDFESINLRSKVHTGDILFSMIGSIGTIYKVEETVIDFAIKNVALFKTSQKENFKNYFFQYLYSYDMQRYIPNVTSGSIQKFIGLTSLRQTPVLYNEKLINLFNENTDSLYNKMNINLKQNKELISLRDWLLPMLMNGQVIVGGA